MDRYLNVQLILQRDCKMIAVDFSDYNSIGPDIRNHVMLDFLVYKNSKTPLEDSIKLRHTYLNQGYSRQKFETEYILKNDGTYTYYKFVIPTFEHFVSENTIINDVFDEIFFYDGNIYGYNKTENINTGSELLEHSEIIDSLLKVYDIVFNNHATQTFYLPAKKIFSICKLNKCLVSLQKDLLFNKSCNDTTKINRDFLLSAMYVFDYLRDIDNYSEAQRLLDNMGDCFYCQDNINNDCNCGSI